MPEQVETVADLLPLLDGESSRDRPLYARTPHGTFWFVVERVEATTRAGEDVAVLVLREVQQE